MSCQFTVAFYWVWHLIEIVWAVCGWTMVKNCLESLMNSRDISRMMGQCWSNVVDGVPTLTRQCGNVSYIMYMLGYILSWLCSMGWNVYAFMQVFEALYPTLQIIILRSICVIWSYFTDIKERLNYVCAGIIELSPSTARIFIAGYKEKLSRVKIEHPFFTHLKLRVDMLLWILKRLNPFNAYHDYVRF